MQKEGSRYEGVWVVSTKTQNDWAYTMGVSPCQECVGLGEGKDSKVFQLGLRLFLAVRFHGAEVRPTRFGTLGNRGVGYLECPK